MSLNVMTPHTTARDHLYKFATEFLTIFVVVVAVLGAAGAIHYRATAHATFIEQKASEGLNVALAKTAIARELHGVAADLLYLAEYNQRMGRFDDADGPARPGLESHFLVFSDKKSVYAQIRLLDSRGMEVVRVNNDNGEPALVPAQELQDKSGRYYFDEALALERGEVYISPFDLNVELGDIERPLVPMLRFGTPVFDSAGGKVGILLLNYKGARLIRSFRQAVANNADHVSLLNADGYWLVNPTGNDEWGFMFGHERTFPNSHPQAWQRILQADSGQIDGEDGMFSFATINPLGSASSQLRARSQLSPDEVRRASFWKVVAHLPFAGLGVMEYWRRHFLVYGISLFLLAVGSVLLAHIRVRHALAEIQVGFERRFREILENIDLLAVSVDANRRITFCNHAWLGLVGLDRDQVIGKDWFEEFTPPDIRAESVQRFRALIGRETNSAPHECEIQTRSGDLRLITWNTSLMSNSDEQVVGMTYIGQDITEARQGEEQLRKLSRAVEQSSSTVMIADTDGRIEYVNPKFTEVTGYSFDEVRGKNPRILKSGEMSDDGYRKLWQTITTGGEWRGVFHNRKKNGELYWEAACISAIRDPHGRITHFLAVKENITERRRLEQEAEERKLEMRKNRELAAVGRMANMIAHDLRNPLSSVKMGLQILASRPVKDWGEDEKELKQISLQQIQYMEDILSDLLAYSRPEALKLEWLSMDKLMDTTSILVQKQVEERRAQLTSRYQPGLPTLFGDARKLKQAFSNLIVNAVQSTEAVTNRTPVIHISVELQHDGERPAIRVSICDNGPGIDDELKGHLFEPFYTTRAKGTGLGLAIVKRVVEQHHGEIWLENRETGGACVSVVLPTTPEDARDAVHDRLAAHGLV